MNKTLWIFGQSMSLPFNLNREEDGWPYLVSQQLGMDYQNFAKSAADNFFIYHCYLEVRDQIKADDIVIIGWSHPSRKSFVLDRSNAKQMAVLDTSIYYKTKTQEFIRSSNPVKDSWQKFLQLMKPSNKGVEYYDTWFTEYYSEYEQRCNFQSYVDSVSHTCTGLYLPFFFSKESIIGIDADGTGHMVDFILEHDVAISKDDCHLNENGHKLWADNLITHIRKNQK